MRSRIKELLKGVFHPELEQDIVTAGIFEGAEVEGDKVVVSLIFRKARDPFAVKIKSRVEQTIASAYPDYKVVVVVKEGEKSAERAAKNAAIEEMHNLSTTTNIKHIVAVASGKGGVGKSTVTANLATALAKEGYKVGVLDADIYGPSQSKMFGVEDYLPDAKQVDGHDYIVPAEVGGIKLISIAMFIRKTDALLWRGTMANSALRQLIHQTEWG
jgi:ATP-binding protein involved in chromosome partitioning